MHSIQSSLDDPELAGVGHPESTGDSDDEDDVEPHMEVRAQSRAGAIFFRPTSPSSTALSLSYFRCFQSRAMIPTVPMLFVL